MRTVAFERLAHGAVAASTEGTLVDLVTAIPYLVVPGATIPPLDVLNDIFAKGMVDAGMSGGCRWQSFQISEAEWRELVSALEQGGGRFVHPPDWVRTHADWATWRLANQLRIPFDEQLELKRLQDDEARWRRESEEAGRQGRTDRMLELHLKAVEAGQQSAAIVNRYRLRRGRAF